MITIASLGPYQAKWRFIARVTKKNTIRQFNYKQKEGSGQLFSVNLIDAQCSETRATFFGTAVDKFYDMIQERQMYSFSGGRTKQADKRYCNFDLEITMDEGAKITSVSEDARCPVIVLQSQPLARLEDVAVGTNIDVAGIVLEAEAPSDINTKAGAVRKRADVTLLDESGATIKMTLWGEFCERPMAEGAVILASQVKLGDFAGRSLSTNFGTTLLVGDEALSSGHPRAAELVAWFGANGVEARQNARPLTNSTRGSGPPATLRELKDEAAGMEAADPSAVKFHTVLGATVTYVAHDRAPFYMSCPFEVPDERNEGKTRTCNKKVEQGPDGWCCMADHRSPEPVPRWMPQLSIADASGTQYVSCFDEVALKVIGRSASDAAAMWDARDRDPVAAADFERLFRGALYKRWRLRLKSKKEVWNDEERLKVNVLDCTPINFVTEARTQLREVLAAVSATASA